MGEKITFTKKSMKLIREKSQKNKQKMTEKEKKQEKGFNYKIGKRTYRKTNSQDKVEDKWVSSFEIVDIKSGQIQLKEQNKITLQYFRNLRPERGVNIRESDSLLRVYSDFEGYCVESRKEKAMTCVIRLKSHL